MSQEQDANRPRRRSTPDRRVFWVGTSSLLAAAFSYAFAWRGGLWVVPLSLALAALTLWRGWPRVASSWAKTGIVMASLAVITSGYSFASTGGLQPALRTDSSSYVQGDVVDVGLKAGIRYVGYNLCFGWATLERLDGGSWTSVDVVLGPPDAFCTAEMLMLPSLRGVEEKVHLPRHLPAGEYRLAYDLEIEGVRRKFATDPFLVGPGGR